MTTPLRIVLALILGLAVGALHAQPTRLSASDFVVRQWHSEDGLPSEDVMQLQQDRAGYLWLACRGGLCRFDGTTFMPEPESAAHDFFFTMLNEPDGGMTLTPRDGHPVRYRNGRFTSEPLPPPFTGRPIGYSLRAPDGAHWYALRGAVVRIDGGSVQSFGAAEGIPASEWTRFAVDARNRVWLASNRFLARYENGRLSKVPVNADASELRIIPSRRGGPWLVTPDQLLKFDEDDRAIPMGALPPLLGAHYVNAGCEDRQGLLWLGTRSEGLQVFTGAAWLHLPTSSDNILTLLEDRDGLLWVGASIGGLNAVARKMYTLYNKDSGLAATRVSAVCADTAGDIWVANGDGGVARIRESQIDTWTLLRGSRPLAAGSVTWHPGGGVWATGGTGAAVFRITGESHDMAIVGDVPSGGISATTFTSKNGDLWVTTTERWVGRLSGHTYRRYGPDEGVPITGVRTFSETPEGDLLIGTNDGTLRRFDGARFVATQWPIDAPSAINAIMTVEKDLWLGTASNGLAILRDGRTAYLETPNGLPDDNITQLISDGQGYVWCGSGRGVFRIAIADVDRWLRDERRTVTALKLGKDEGLGTLVCQGIFGPGAARSRGGRLWFATRQGVLAVNPSAEALAPRAPEVRIERVLADDVPQAMSRPWIAAPSARKLEFQFSVLCLSAPRRAVVRYRLVGFDTTWVQSRPGGAATYPHLPPGKYRFEIAAGFGGASDSSIDILDLVVPPLWWQTAWARAGALVLAVTAVTLIVRSWSHRRLRRRIEKLERETAVARVRERIARDIHDEVGASLTRISLLTQTSLPNSPEAENLNRIDETAREVTRSLDEIVWAVNPRYDTLESFIRYLTDFAQKFLGEARIRCRLVIPPRLPPLPLASDTRHDLFLCCRESLNNVIKHAGASEVTIRIAFTEPTLTVAIMDNGHGLLARSGTEQAGRTSSGHGLANLNRRIEHLGGSCTLQSPPGGGTSVTLTVSLPPPSPPSS